MKNNKCKYLFIIVALLTSYCKESDLPTEVIESPDNSETINKNRSILHGYWKNTDTNNVAFSAIKYVTFDTLHNKFVEKRDYGNNFRSELKFNIKVVIDKLLYTEDDVYLWYHLDTTNNILTLSRDSLFINKGEYKKDSSLNWLNNWYSSIPFNSSTQIQPYHTITKDIKGMTNYGDTLYILCSSGNDNAIIYILNQEQPERIDSLIYPYAKAIEITKDTLWIVQNSFYNYSHLEKRLISDNSLIETYDISSYTREVLSITVSDNNILICSTNFLFIFNNNIDLINKVSTYHWINDMSFFNDRIIVTTMNSPFFEYDYKTGNATKTYVLNDDNLAVRFQGITINRDKVYLADNLMDYLKIITIDVPK